MLPEGLDAARLGSRARHRDRHAPRATSTKKDALKYVAGYCVVNDVSERDFQLKKGASPVEQGQGLRHVRSDRARGSSRATRSRTSQNLDMWLDVNGVRRQTGNTQTMIFGVAELVADVSQYMTLLARRRAGNDGHAEPAGRRPA